MGTPTQKTYRELSAKFDAEYRKEHGLSQDAPVVRTLSDFQRLDWPAQPMAKIRDGKIICDHCSAPANTIHLLPYQGEEPWQRIEAGCPNHDPGGYWIDLHRLFEEPYEWLHHLMEKQTGPAGFDPVSLIIEWLGHEGCRLVDESRPHQVKE